MQNLELWANTASAQTFFNETPALGLAYLIFGGFLFLLTVGLCAGIVFRLSTRETPRIERKNAPVHP